MNSYATTYETTHLGCTVTRRISTNEAGMTTERIELSGPVDEQEPEQRRSTMGKRWPGV